jgi:hypothetical protein
MASSLSHVDGPKLGRPLIKVIVLLRFSLLRAYRRTTDIGFQVRWGMFMCFGGSVVLVFGTFRQLKLTNWR